MNCILIILDTLRKDHVGAYGNPWVHTPSLDSFGRQAVVFDNAFPESLPTIPVRRALATGNRTFPYTDHCDFKGDTVHTFGWRPIPEDQTTLAEVLHGHGYTTGLISDTWHLFKPSMNFHRGFDQFTWIRGQENDRYKSAGDVDEMIDGHLLSKPEFKYRQVDLLERYFRNVRERHGEEDYFAPKVFTEAMAWVEENAGNKFFLTIDSFDPHEPWDPPEAYRELYPGAQDYAGAKIIWSLYGSVGGYAPGELEYMRACYAGEVTMVDAWLGKFLQKVQSLGLNDSTMIVIVSDHGHQLGEHGITGKVAWGLYPELIDLVLMVQKPGIPPRRVNELVYNLEVTPTILRGLGVEWAGRICEDGQDLAPLLEDKAGWTKRSHITVGFNHFIQARDDQHAYITDAMREREELYDIVADPQMAHNIARGHRKICDRMFNYVLQDAGGAEGLRAIAALAPDAKKQAEEWYKLTE